MIVVDQSGSMRNTDASEGVTRSDLAWLTVAVEYVAASVKKGERKETDVLSIITMRQDATIVVEHEPFDWILFNKIVDIFRTSDPLRHGYYLPSLTAAKNLLTSNDFASCALQMIILSDVRPSDQLPGGPEACKSFAKMYINEIASQLGNRFTFGAIALGQPGHDDFSTLKALADTAKQYSNSFFQRATLNADAISKTMSSLSDSVTATMMDLTDESGLRQRQVRKFV